MITSIHFKNFKALRDCTLPLGRFTLLVGPNGSGKSTAMQALKIARQPKDVFYDEVISITSDDPSTVEIKIVSSKITACIKWYEGKDSRGVYDFEEPTSLIEHNQPSEDIWKVPYKEFLMKEIGDFKLFAFDAEQIAKPVPIRKSIELEQNGLNLAGVIDDLRDRENERFEALNKELNRWLPEFKRISFNKPSDGMKALSLETMVGNHKIKASDLSHGTLLALAYLTIAYLPNPPAIVCFEEPEHGIHPRLLREIRNAMYRLAYPEDFGEKREPVQVIATTHSPYLLDLYKDHPEEIVIAEKDESGVHFQRLSDKPNYQEFLQNAPLGEVWYSGVLGGVPAQP